MIRLLLVFAALFAGGIRVSPLQAGDWPTWRYDAGRGASASDALPDGMSLRWTRELEPSQPAWPPTQTKLQFDRVPEPVVAGKRIFIPSNVTDTVTAYDTETGDEIWRFYADGPVRFAPVATTDRVYFVSDDGHLYALKSGTGQLVWKFNGGPAERPVLGNGRLVSSWPARGGPVLHEGKIYFAASIWPFMGIFIHCLDPESGEVLWTNSGDGTNYIIHPHNAPSFGGVAPQGHLAAAGDSLIVPGGRSTPAVYNALTGELHHFEFDKKAGSYAVEVRGSTYFVAGNTYDLATGELLGRGEPVVGDDVSLLSISGDRIVATASQGKRVERIGKDRRGTEIKRHTVQWHELFSCWLENPPGDVFIRAGDRLYSAGKGKVAAYNLPEGGKAVWTTRFNGTAATMLAADDKLFVVDDASRLYCFGVGDGKPVTHTLERSAPPSHNRASELVQEIAAKRPTGQGYAVLLGIGSGDLIDELLEQTKYFVIAVDPDTRRVDAFRRKMTAAGLYGRRTSAHVGNPLSFPYPQYAADLIFSETVSAAELSESSAIKHLFNALRPYGGAIALELDEDRHTRLSQTVAAAELAGARVERTGSVTEIVRAGALPGSDDWTHQYGDATQSVVSHDALVKAPLGLLWFGGPPNDEVLPRHGHGPSPQVAGGRVFVEGPDMLRAVDVYTGRVLWQIPLPGLGDYYDSTFHQPGAGEIGSNYVSLIDRVYVVYGDSILELDSATGAETRRFQLKSEEGKSAPNWGYIAVSGNYLVATSAPLDVSVGKSLPRVADSSPSTYLPVIKRGDTWKYLAGSDPDDDDWNTRAFDDSGWKSGKAGFGYGDKDDATVLNMRNKFTRVYLRKTFDRSAVKDGARLGLMINYDDAFVAYLNGKEIIRRGVKGDGAAAKVSSHEAAGHEFIEIEGGADLLRRGKNLLAVVGYNVSPSSSDFTLDPYLVYAPAKSVADKPEPSQTSALSDALSAAWDKLTVSRYAAGSRRLEVFDRKTGKTLWHRDAALNFRHNNIAVSKDRIFCIDALTGDRLSAMRRRGVTPKGTPTLYALDLATGKELWKNKEDVFGTFLNYNEERDMLLQAGSSNRDRAKDEVSTGIIAYRGADGEVLWTKKDFKHGGPCLLWKDLILTNGGGGVALDAATGEPTGWSYSRQYGCNAVIGSEHLLTFRSGAAGFCDLLNDSGTGNLGGFKSSCTSNLIVADGVLNAPDYTRTCTCAYQNQTSLALVYMPEAEFWTFGGTLKEGRTGINLGAPGDRRDENGTLWLDVPSQGGQSEKVRVTFAPERPALFRHHAATVESGDLPWVAASGAEGLKEMTIDVAPGDYDIRLIFLEPEPLTPGERVFDVLLQGKPVLTAFDITATAGGPRRSISRTFRASAPDGNVRLAFRAATKRPVVLSGVELIAR